MINIVTVIKKGNKNLFEEFCFNCGSILVYGHGDTFYDDLSFSGEDVYIKCPVCGLNVAVRFIKHEEKEV